MSPVLLVALAIVACGMAVTSANEPLWTDAQRLENREVVCVAKVLSTEKVGPINDREEVYRAMIEITGMKKGPRIASGSKFPVYYEFAKSGQNDRCPTYAQLAKGDQRTFYLRHLTEPIQVSLKLASIEDRALFLEMGSDAQPLPGARPRP